MTEKAIDLHKTTDAVAWAEEFCRTVGEKHPSIQNEDTEHWIMGWFANAIMTGHDHALRANGLAVGCSEDYPE